MEPNIRWRKTLWLCALVLVALVFVLLLNIQRPLTGTNAWDGIVSVLLRLYICSQPAANFLDALLFRHYTAQPNATLVSELLWWTLNVLVLVVGWNVIFIGMVRFTGS
jgi:hypothetical protein